MPEKRLIIKTDVEDWHQEFVKLEPTLKDDEQIIAFVLAGHHTAQAARMLIVSRDLDFSPADIINPNKLLMQYGAQDEIHTKIKKVRYTLQAPSGKEYEVRTYIGTRQGEEDSPTEGEAPYVEATSKAGLQLAIRYLERVVPGHIFERFKQIVANKGDLGAAADRLHDDIDEMVRRLMEPQSG